MENGQQLAQRFRDVVLEGKWIANTNLKMLLDSLDFKEANTKVSNLNTIALLTFHINYYVAGVLQVLQGGPLDIKDKYSFDMPAIENEDDWNRLKVSLYQNASQFADAVAQLSEEELGEGFVKPEYGTFRRNIEGMIEHTYYHFGQVSLISKMLKESN